MIDPIKDVVDRTLDKTDNNLMEIIRPIQVEISNMENEYLERIQIEKTTLNRI